MSDSKQGTVKWFNNAKGYGFEKVKDGYEQPEAVAVEENVSQETSADF